LKKLDPTNQEIKYLHPSSSRKTGTSDASEPKSFHRTCKPGGCFVLLEEGLELEGCPVVQLEKGREPGRCLVVRMEQGLELEGCLVVQVEKGREPGRCPVVLVKERSCFELGFFPKEQKG
jgi:hypothetical protein